jgi:hypothetical protein
MPPTVTGTYGISCSPESSPSRGVRKCIAAVCADIQHFMFATAA